MKLKHFILLLIPVIIFSECKVKKEMSFSKNTTQIFEDSFALAPIYITHTSESFDHKFESIKNYQASRTKFNDLIHTELYLSFDYEKQYAFAKANITLKPHYYPTDTLELDARGFDIHKIELADNKRTPIDYKYNGKIIKINLDKKYNRNEKYTIYIEYTAKPSELKKNGFWAIKDDRGLYFINPDSDDPQIWTQGETQSNSCWFPTIDAPNQKMTQDIHITVKNEFKTLSNGVLHSSILNDDGTRTDRWKQDKPHAPYLAMLTVGKFEIIENHWRELPIFVYVKPKDTEKAKQVFGKTYKMMDFFSDKFDFDYPWDKYHQVVVDDFISGAMENTSASVFGSYVLNFRNEEQRINNESIVAHELSHHWFGDLVTCESWANLPLNESFATYCEYLWFEHEYGRFEADKHLQTDRSQYMFESFYKNENLIRFYHKHRDNMFDMHSYQKGSTILHMLRYTVGDDAFFDALELYLKRNKFNTAEIHDLRLAFEDITGQDLNWFFNQWFLNKGYPKLEIEYKYNKNNKLASVTVKQTQDLSKNPAYKIPVNIDFYTDNKVVRKKVVLDEQEEVFSFEFDKKPELINFDADKMLLCKKIENKTTKEYIFQLENAPLFADKEEAFDYLKKYSAEQTVKAAFLKMMKHEYWYIRLRALKLLNIKNKNKLFPEYKKLLKDLSENDKNEKVQKLAKKLLLKY